MGVAEEDQIWEEIERAESCLVSSMFEEASEMACSIIRKTIEKKMKIENGEGEEEEREREIEVLECCGMVILQSLHNDLSSSSTDILSVLSSSIELKLIPPRLILTGACFEMSSSSPDGPSRVAKGLEKYLEEVMDVSVAEFFTVDVLAIALQDFPRALTWLRHNSHHLPQDTSQELLTRLQNLPKPVKPSATKSPEQSSSSSLDISEKQNQQPLLGLSKRVEPCFWWLRVLNPKLLLGCLALVLYWNLRRKQLSLKGTVKRQASKLKQAMIEVWQLAFSHPLAYA